MSIRSKQLHMGIEFLEAIDVDFRCRRHIFNDRCFSHFDGIQVNRVHFLHTFTLELDFTTINDFSKSFKKLTSMIGALNNTPRGRGGKTRSEVDSVAKDVVDELGCAEDTG